MSATNGRRRPVPGPSAGPSAGPATCPSDGQEAGEPAPGRAEEYVALGRALAARADDILARSREQYFVALQASDLEATADREAITQDPLWQVTSIATLSIVRWLETGEVAKADERTQISSLGQAAAHQRARVAEAFSHALELAGTRATSRIANGRPQPGATGGEPASTDGGSAPEAARGSAPAQGPRLSVTMLTKLNLWWADNTCDVLHEEAARLGTPDAVVEQATEMVVRSSRASLVGMAKRFDAEMASLHQRLADLALHDTLTGLSNRMVLIDQLDRALARLGRREGGLALVFIDLDDFKTVNDVHGHGCGDALLTEVADRLLANVRAGDLVARLGGDEFVVLFEGLANPSAEAQRRAERIREVIAQPLVIDGTELRVTVSAGVATIRKPGLRSEDVLAQADAAMYSAKRAGRNRVAVVEIDDGPRHVRFATTSGLHRALERQELRLEYQPIYDSRNRSIAGFEALLRWDHPERGTISPAEFIPIAEESGLMVAIGEWVLEEACRQAMGWSRFLDVPPRMAVNVSARQLDDREFVRRVSRILERTAMPPTCLMLEITETVLLGEDVGHEATLNVLKDLGVQLAIDDFGTGYSSLAYLRRFPVDQLKVDRSFVRDVAEHGDTRIMRAVVGLAHELGLEVVAEGVETGDELDVVQRLGCDVVQGFLLGRPVPPEAIDLGNRQAPALA